MWLLMEGCEVTPVTDRGGRRNSPTEPGLRCGLTLDLGQTVLEHSALEAMCLALSVRQLSVVGALVTGDRTEPPGWRPACGGQMWGEPSPTLPAPGRGSTVSATAPVPMPEGKLVSCALCPLQPPVMLCARFLSDLPSQMILKTKTGILELAWFLKAPVIYQVSFPDTLRQQDCIVVLCLRWGEAEPHPEPPRERWGWAQTACSPRSGKPGRGPRRPHQWGSPCRCLCKHSRTLLVLTWGLSPPCQLSSSWHPPGCFSVSHFPLLILQLVSGADWTRVAATVPAFSSPPFLGGSWTAHHVRLCLHSESALLVPTDCGQDTGWDPGSQSMAGTLDGVCDRAAPRPLWSPSGSGRRSSR